MSIFLQIYLLNYLKNIDKDIQFFSILYII